jgi:hypothetical protein
LVTTNIELAAIGAGVHGETQIGSGECGGIVYPVTGHRHGPSRRLKL